MTSRLSLSTIAQAELDNHQYNILYTVYYYIVSYCISNHGTPSYSPWLIISVVIPLPLPPISIIPASVDQLVWRYLLSIKAWLVTQWPDVKVMQVLVCWLVRPPHISRLSMVWSTLLSGSEGSRHPVLSLGLNTSTLVSVPSPPDIIIPGIYYEKYRSSIIIISSQFYFIIETKTQLQP